MVMIGSPALNSTPRRAKYHKRQDSARKAAMVFIKRRQSEIVWAKVTVSRKRQPPAGTVGGRIAGAKCPAARNRCAMPNAAASSPNITGIMGARPSGTFHP